MFWYLSKEPSFITCRSEKRFPSFCQWWWSYDSHMVILRVFMNCPIHVVEKTHKMNISAYIIIYHPTPQLRTMAPWFFYHSKFKMAASCKFSFRFWEVVSMFPEEPIEASTSRDSAHMSTKFWWTIASFRMLGNPKLQNLASNLELGPYASTILHVCCARSILTRNLMMVALRVSLPISSSGSRHSFVWRSSFRHRGTPSSHPFIDGIFQKWGIPNSWMVYNMENPIYKWMI